MLHGAGGASRGAVLLCPADGEERAWSLRTYVRLARALAERDLAVLRFDYMGQGESGGAYEDADVGTRLADIEAASAFLRAQTSRQTVTALGLRLGATLALEAAAGPAQIDTLVLWEPVFDTAAYVQHLLRVNLTMQMVQHKQVVRDSDQLRADLAAGGRVSANGYNLTDAFVTGVSGLEPAARLAQFRGPVAIMATPATRVPGTGPEVMRHAIAPFWREPKTDMTPPTAFIAATADWIDARFAQGGK